MYKNNVFSLVPVVLMVLLAVSCEKAPDEPSGAQYGAGVFIVNEGFFNYNNGSVSYYNPEDETLIHHIFEAANGRSPGDVIQSFAIHADTTGFIVVNGSGKLEVVNLKNFKTIIEPLAFSYPRYFLPVSATKGYLTNGSSKGQIYVVDLKDFIITDTIPTGLGPESMVKIDDLVYVCNSGGWSSDSTLTVINAISDRAVDTFHVGQVPADIVLDGDRNIWVYCKGYANYDWNPPYDLISETASYLQKIDPVLHEIVWQHEVGKAGDYTVVLPKLAASADGLYVYFLRPDGVYRLSVLHPEPPDDPLITGSFYGIEVHPTTGDLYLFEASLTGQGIMKVFDSSLNPVVSHEVGIMPNGAAFIPR